MTIKELKEELNKYSNNDKAEISFSVVYNDEKSIKYYYDFNIKPIVLDQHINEKITRVPYVSIQTYEYKEEE